MLIIGPPIFPEGELFFFHITLSRLSWGRTKGKGQNWHFSSNVRFALSVCADMLRLVGSVFQGDEIRTQPALLHRKLLSGLLFRFAYRQ